MTLPPADHHCPEGSKRWANGPKGLPSVNRLLNVLGKVNGRPAAVGAMDVLVVGDVLVAAVSWRLLPRPAGAHFAVEKQLGAAWRLASCRLPLRQSVYPAVSPRTRDLENVHLDQGSGAWLV